MWHRPERRVQRQCVEEKLAREEFGGRVWQNGVVRCWCVCGSHEGFSWETRVSSPGSARPSGGRGAAVWVGNERFFASHGTKSCFMRLGRMDSRCKQIASKGNMSRGVENRRQEGGRRGGGGDETREEEVVLMQKRKTRREMERSSF